MNNRREHRIRMGDHGVKLLGCSLWFILFFLLSAQFLIAGSDTTKTTKYELNDPRNPDCPCHKLQKQAEDEYARLNKEKAAVDQIGNNLNVQEDKKVGNEAQEYIAAQVKRSPVASTANTAIYKRKRKTERFMKLKFRFFNKPKGIKRVRPNYSVCTKW